MARTKRSASDGKERPTSVKLWDGNPFLVDSVVIDGDKSSDDNKNELKITNHCKVMFGEMGNGASYSDEQRRNAKVQLGNYKEHIMERATEKLRSLYMSELRRNKVFHGSWDAATQQLQSDKVTLKLIQSVFSACFTVIEERKEYWFENTAKEIIVENCVTFVNSGQDGMDGIKCVASLVHAAVPNSRRPVMKGANRGRNIINMSTRRSKENFWTARPKGMKAKQHEFAYEKIDGWAHLVQWDPEAKRIYEEHHPKKDPPITHLPDYSGGGQASTTKALRGSATTVSHDHSLITTLPQIDAETLSMFQFPPSDGSVQVGGHFLDGDGVGGQSSPDSLANNDDLVSSLPVRMKQQGDPTNGFWGATAGRECHGDSSNLSRVLPQRDFVVDANTNHRPMLSDMSAGTEVSFAHVLPCRRQIVLT